MQAPAVQFALPDSGVVGSDVGCDVIMSTVMSSFASPIFATILAISSQQVYSALVGIDEVTQRHCAPFVGS